MKPMKKAYPMSVHWPSLTADRRARDLEALASERVDVLVVGGGVMGTGIALDAAARGLSVALVERDDLASGTSSASSRVIHGGTRYLASANIGLALESALERRVLMQHVAPHLVRTMPMVIPELGGVRKKTKRLTRLGLRAGDLVRLVSGTDKELLPHPRRIPATEAEALLPGLTHESVTGAMLSFDAQLEDDARLVVALARTAAAHGARILTRVRAEKITGTSARLVDERTGHSLTATAQVVISAIGVWASDLEPSIALSYRRGTHILLPSALLGDPRASLAVSATGSPTDVVFAIPQSDGLVMVGTTDIEADSREDAEPTAGEVDHLLRTINRALRTTVTEADVVGRFAGLRPMLVDVDEDESNDLARQHAIAVSASGAINVVGGKITTYRRVAEEALDRALGSAMVWAGECRTKTLGLVGATSLSRLAEIDAPERLVRRYGTEAPAILALIEKDRDLGERVVPQLPYLRAELVWGIQQELALTPEDLVDRRTRIGTTVYREPALEIAGRLLEIARV